MKLKTFYLDDDLIEKLNLEKNGSELVRKIIRDYYDNLELNNITEEQRKQLRPLLLEAAEKQKAFNEVNMRYKAFMENLRK